MHDIAKKGHLKRLKKIAHCTFGLTVKQRQNKHINYLRYGVGAAGSESFQMCNELFFFMTFFGDIVHLIVRLSLGLIDIRVTFDDVVYYELNDCLALFGTKAVVLLFSLHFLFFFYIL
jgi:hypothetical protein